ncbi:MAG: hypothetical protein V3U02_12020, partial [Calditrichia bacterium]
MNVSRETSLSNLLLSITKNLNIDKNVFSANRSFSGLTSSAASLFLLSINSINNKPSLVVLDTITSAEQLYITCYNLVPDEIAFFPESASKNTDIPGFNLENERY